MKLHLFLSVFLIIVSGCNNSSIDGPGKTGNPASSDDFKIVLINDIFLDDTHNPWILTDRRLIKLEKNGKLDLQIKSNIYAGNSGKGDIREDTAVIFAGRTAYMLDADKNFISKKLLNHTNVDDVGINPNNNIWAVEEIKYRTVSTIYSPQMEAILNFQGQKIEIADDGSVFALFDNITEKELQIVTYIKKYSQSGELIDSFEVDNVSIGKITDRNDLKIDSNGHVWVLVHGKIKKFDLKGNQIPTDIKATGFFSPDVEDFEVDSGKKFFWILTSEPLRTNQKLQKVTFDGEVIYTFSQNP